MNDYPSVVGTNYFPLTSAALNELISYRIQFVDGIVSVTVNGVTQVINIVDYDGMGRAEVFISKPEFIVRITPDRVPKADASRTIICKPVTLLHPWHHLLPVSPRAKARTKEPPPVFACSSKEHPRLLFNGGRMALRCWTPRIPCSIFRMSARVILEIIRSS